MHPSSQNEKRLETNQFKSILQDLKDGHELDPEIKDELLEYLLSEDPQKLGDVDEKLKEELLGQLLFTGEKKDSLTMEQWMELIRMKYKNISRINADLGELVNDLSVLDPGAKEGSESCVRGILKVAWFGATKEEMIEMYMQGAYPDESYSMFLPNMYRHLADTPHNRKRVSATIGNLLSEGILKEENGILFAHVNEIMAVPPYIKRIKLAKKGAEVFGKKKAA